jgi:hypothetical protein
VEADAVAQQHRGQVDDDLVEEARLEALAPRCCPKLTMFLPPAAARAVATASSTLPGRRVVPVTSAVDGAVLFMTSSAIVFGRRGRMPTPWRGPDR